MVDSSDMRPLNFFDQAWLDLWKPHARAVIDVVKDDWRRKRNQSLKNLDLPPMLEDDDDD